MKILHVFGVLSRSGGAEKWVLDLFDQLQSEPFRAEVQFDFLLSVDDGPCVEHVRQAGSKVFFVPFSHSPIPLPGLNPYLSGVDRILRSESYDWVHLHQFDLAGEIMRIARRRGVERRAMSLHNPTYSRDHSNGVRRMVYQWIGRPWIFRYATDFFAACDATGAEFVGSSAQTPRMNTIYYGIDPTPFYLHESEQEREMKRKAYRKELQIGPDQIVVGNVARFALQKNHPFLIRLAEQVMKSDRKLVFVFIGDGPERSAIERLAQRHGVEQQVRFCGIRKDIPDLMNFLFDVLVIPSFYEGGPIVAWEALAAGLPFLMSDRIQTELERFFPDRVKRLSLESSPAQWCESLEHLAQTRLSPERAREEFESSPLTIQRSLRHLLKLYGLKPFSD